MTDNDAPVEATLPTGEKVMRYSDGREVLQATNSLADTLGQQVEDQEAANEVLRETLIAATVSKREALDHEYPVPGDKRVI